MFFKLLNTFLNKLSGISEKKFLNYSGLCDQHKQQLSFFLFNWLELIRNLVISIIVDWSSITFKPMTWSQ